MAEGEPKLLIVEDDTDIAEMLAAFFQKRGYQLQIVSEGEAALAACRGRQPELVLLDIRLPDIDGYEVARRLRSNRRTAKIPIIFLTERRARRDRLEGLSLGVDDYITKPFDIQELALRVQNTLRRAASGSTLHSVTGLPDGEIVTGQLENWMKRRNWAVIGIHIRNLAAFGERYGFVAADDVLRAVGRMIQVAVQPGDEADDFVGHLADQYFLVLSREERVPELADAIRQRLEGAVAYFYPLQDRLGEHTVPDSLNFNFSIRSVADSSHLTGYQLATELQEHT